jgi:hypothetical protein
MEIKKCYRRSCQKEGATWYNHSTEQYYCPTCARQINNANKADAFRLFGHELCTPDAELVAQEAERVSATLETSRQYLISKGLDPDAITARGTQLINRMVDKHQDLSARIRKDLMLAPLFYKQHEINVTKKGDSITVTMLSEEDQKRRSPVPLIVTASLVEWHALFIDTPRLAQHLAAAFA